MIKYPPLHPLVHYANTDFQSVCGHTGAGTTTMRPQWVTCKECLKKMKVDKK